MPQISLVELTARSVIDPSAPDPPTQSNAPTSESESGVAAGSALYIAVRSCA